MGTTELRYSHVNSAVGAYKVSMMMMKLNISATLLSTARWRSDLRLDGPAAGLRALRVLLGLCHHVFGRRHGSGALGPSQSGLRHHATELCHDRAGSTGVQDSLRCVGRPEVHYRSCLGKLLQHFGYLAQWTVKCRFISDPGVSMKLASECFKRVFLL